uniref:ribosome biogenesis protein BOP1 n=1 Tax=Lonchura striata TaxID=40157 RepID=UPI000B4CA715
FPHVGYDLDGKKIYKPLRSKDELDLFLEKMENPEYWRTVQDGQTGAEVPLSEEQLELIRRLQRGNFGDVGFDPYEPAVDFFSHEVRIHPVTNRPADKRSFIPSLVEKEKVSKLVHAIKMGWIQPRKPKENVPTFYDLWAREDPNSVLGRHKMHVPAPKIPLPGHAESYNPPPEFLLSPEEQLAWEQQDPAERRPSFIPRKFRSLRAVPAYSRFIHERFERCLDLYLCPRQRRMRVNVDPEDLIPKLPRPRDLQPFPTTQALIYRGHSSLVRTLSVSPSGQWLVSGSDDGTVRFWEVSTARCLRSIPVGSVVRSVAWNPNPSICLVAVALIGWDRHSRDPVGIGIPEIWVFVDQSQPVTQVTWHGKGDYWASVVIHRPVTQVTWHGKGDYWASVVRNPGDNVICGSYDSKLAWFDLDLSTRPYRLLRHHGRAVRAVAFHRRFPLFASGSDDGSVIVCHGMVYSDLLQNALLVPLKVLRGHAARLQLGVLDVAFHPQQPWLFSAGADGTLRLYA